MKVDKARLYIFAIVCSLFILGLYTLFSLRFQVGDVYPPYSSLRSDPLGTKIFYKSLANMEAIHVRRNHRPITQFIGNRDTTLLMIGLDDYWIDMMNTHIHNALSNLAVSGGRLVVSFYPTQRIHEPLSDNEELEPESNQDCDDEDDLTTGEASLKSDEEGSVDSASKPSSGSPEGSDENEEDWSKGKTISLSEKWGVRIGYLKEQEQSAAHLVPIHRNQSLPSSITCHTT